MENKLIALADAMVDRRNFIVKMMEKYGRDDWFVKAEQDDIEQFDNEVAKAVKLRWDEDWVIAYFETFETADDFMRAFSTKPFSAIPVDKF